MRVLPLCMLLVLCTLCGASAKVGSCLGKETSPDLNAACKLFKSTQSCLKGFSEKGVNISNSCVWRETYTDEIVEKVVVYTKLVEFSNMFQNDAEVIGTRVQVTLPKDSTNRWGLYSNLYTEASTSACTVGLGLPLDCLVKNVPPKGYAQSPLFVNITNLITFNIRDVKLAQQVQKNNGLLDKQVPLTMKYTFYRAGASPAPVETNYASTSLSLGSFTTNTGEFYLDTYYPYRVRNVSGISWDVNVTKSLEANGSTTPLTVFLMKEADYNIWSAEGCKTTCKPPTKLAIKDTLCSGLKCSGRAKNLDGNKQYRLLISYPTIYGYEWAENRSTDGPIENPFSEQVVGVAIRAKNYVLGDALASRTVVTDGDSEYAMIGSFV